MTRLPRRGAPRLAAVAMSRLRGATAFGALAAVTMFSPFARYPYIPQPPPGGRPPVHTHVHTAAAFHQIVLPDLAVIKPQGISEAEVAALHKIHGLRQLLVVDGAAITVGGHRVNAIGVDPQQFRAWTPVRTASDQRLWQVLGKGGFVASTAARHLLKLHPGHQYPLAGGSTVTVPYGGAAALGIAGIDVVVSNKASAQLGLIHNVAALVSAPGVPMTTLRREVRAALGGSGHLVSLRQQQLPVDHTSGSGRPATYLQLFQRSAALYCPGMSWTVLAAIGQIESGDGANTGPSTAGALGPMQFLPSTWAVWGITAFGEAGPPDIMDPYDAVPSAARLLCADGAGTPAGLPAAVFAYNHASWYVSEVLALAQQYARLYG